MITLGYLGLYRRKNFYYIGNNPDKWWYWDFSDNEKVEIIMKS